MNVELKSGMIISRSWLQIAVLTFAIGFGILAYLAYSIYQEHAPIPDRFVGPSGNTIFARADVLAGQQLFATRGLMEQGTIFGHGAYLGPDFTADALHSMEAVMQRSYGNGPDTAQRIRDDFKSHGVENGVVHWSQAQVEGWQDLLHRYGQWLGSGVTPEGLQGPKFDNPDEIRAVASFVAWSAWAATAQRPGKDYSYTNNWPPDPAVGNVPTADTVFWSAVSLVALLAGIGATLFAFGRWQRLGWHRDETAPETLVFRNPHEIRLTPAQRATVWYFLVVTGLFLAQALSGGLNAHYHAEASTFFGIPVGNWFTYHTSRTWHLQLALFFVASAYMALGIFLAPMISGSEPRHQEKLTLTLFVALVAVVTLSLAGEYLSYRGIIRGDMAWWFGAQGFEYLDLGRVFQIALTGGLVLWAVIIFRGLRGKLAHEHPGNMPWLFLYSTLSIPLFLRRRNGLWTAHTVCNHGLLAVLGGASVG